MLFKNMPIPENGALAKVPNVLIQSGINAKYHKRANVRLAQVKIRMQRMTGEK